MNPVSLFAPLSVDPLSLFFIAVILLVSLPAAVHSAGYLRGEYPAGKIARAWMLFLSFVASMLLVVTASNALFFLIVWEIMSLVSYAFVVFDTENERSVRAGLIYIVMTHIGTALISAAFLVLYSHAGSFDLAAMKTAARTLPAPTRDLLFFLFLAGFGTKAGIVPLHVWLPYAHPRAPSHVSALMSGVMIKTAIYGIIRFVIGVLGVETAWWGNVVLAVASATCLIGVIYALMEHDLKRLLAYSSVENIGIILLGLGASMVFMGTGMPVLALLALSAGLYHTVNHAIFKSLLFLGAGNILRSTGLRDMEKMGGLVRTMPWTAGTFLAGALAISAIPPFNGFAGEWLTLQALFLGAVNSTSAVKMLMSACAAVLALTGGLAAACFVKAFGISFLALPRSEKARTAREAPPSMLYATVFLAGLALLFGLAASPLLKVITAIASSASGIDAAGVTFTLNNLVLAPRPGSGTYLSVPYVALALVLAALAGYAVVRTFFAANTVTRARTWGCGYYALGPRTEYTATAFSKPFRIAFSFLLKPYSRTEKIKETYYHIKTMRHEVRTTPVIKQYLYDSALALVMHAAKNMRRLQTGSIHIYIAYIFITVMLLIIFL